MDRGYERFEEKLIGVGAQIQRLGNVFAPREPVAVTAYRMARDAHPKGMEGDRGVLFFTIRNQCLATGLIL